MAAREHASQTCVMRLRRWSRSDWLLVVGVAGLLALLVRGALRAHRVPTVPFGMGLSELLVIVVILLFVFIVARRR